MEKIKIYYFENKDNLNSADGLDFNQNIDDCINYILTILKKDFNFISSYFVLFFISFNSL